jgi:membrane dipeptidase
MDRRQFFRTSSMAGLAAGVPMVEGARAEAASLETGFGLLGPPLPEMLVVDGVSPSELAESYVGMLETAGVTGWHKSMGGNQSFADAWSFLDAHADRIGVATTVRGIREAYRANTVALIFGWQDADSLGTVSGQKVTPLRAYYQMGLRIVNLVYNVMNQFAGGCLEPHMGLTRTGKRLVEEIGSLGIIVDVGGHTGEQSSLEAIEVARGLPVICSHTNMAGLIDNPRNISDRLAEAIAATGGVIGLTAINDFNARNRSDANVLVTPQVRISALLDQYDYLKSLVGAEHIGMGNDFTEGLEGRIDPTLPQFTREMASEQSPIFYVKGYEKITELPNLINGLRDRGWTEGEIKNVMGENWLRVYAKVWGS